MGASKSESESIDILKGKLSSISGELGNVRHPRRLIKIYRRIFYRQLGVSSKDKTTTPADGTGTVYLATKEDVKKIINESERRKRFQDKWIHFAFLKGVNQQWYIYDPASENIRERDSDQINKFGMYGFVKVDEKLVEENEKLAKISKGKELYKISLIDADLLNCSFGYNYSQASMQISITLSNDKGKNRGIYHSGDIIKVYMWYDKPDKPDFTSKVDAWVKNKDIASEDKKLFSIRQKHYETATTNEEGKKHVYEPTPSRGIYNNGVVLMFTGKVDDVGYDYSKDGGNKLILKGRSLGSVLTDVRIYKSYPSEGRITMPHEEVIYDIISSQVGLPFGHLILSNVDWVIGSIPPKGQRKLGTIFGMDDLTNTEGEDDLKDINRREIEAGANNQYATNVTKGIKDQEKEWMDKINIEDLVELSEEFVNAVFDNSDNIGPNDPVNSGKKFDTKSLNSVTEAELEGKGSTSPLWIYKDGKTGKTYNAGWPNNTSLATIIGNQDKLNRKRPVELKPKRWAEYGIRVPQPIKRSDGKSLNATRLFFIDGWNAVKYIMQQRAVTTSAARATKIGALMASNDPEIVWDTLRHRIPVEGKIDSIWPKREVKGYGDDKIILYQTPSGKKFDVIAFAKSLNIVTADEVEEKEPKKTKNKQMDTGSFDLIEEAIKKGNPDALLRIKIFYQKVRQFTRAFHDKYYTGKKRSAYANTDALLQPVGKDYDDYAVEFPTVKPGQIIVLPKDVINAPRRWVVGAWTHTDDSYGGRTYVNLETDILGVWEGDNYSTFTPTPAGTNDFDTIVPPARRSSDELDPAGSTGGGDNVTLSPVGEWIVAFPDNVHPPEDVVGGTGTKISFNIIEDAKLLRNLKKLSNDLVFDGDTIFDAIKKITSQYFDIIQFVDEFGFYNVRPRFASKIDQRFVYRLEAGKNRFPKLISSQAEENSSQTINRVVLMGKSPGFTEVIIVIVNDDESIRRHGVKQDFVQINKIDNVIDAIKTAKERLLDHRQKIRKVQITCEPILELRPGHRINILDINSALAGPYLIDNVGINYSKSGGAVQTFSANSVGDFYNTDDLSGQVAYYSKGEGDALKLQNQYSEKQIKEGKHLAQKATI